MATQAAEKTKRGDGPLVITFIDDKNVEHKRVTDGVQQVKVVAKGGKHKLYSVSALAPKTREQLAAERLKARFDIFARNTVKEDAGADVLLATDHVYGMLKDGTLFSRKEGGSGGPGKSFDFDRMEAVIKAMVILMEKNKVKKKDGSLHKALTDKQLAEVRVSLEARTPKDRTKWIADQRKGNPFFVLAEKKYDAAAAEEAIADGDFDAEDLF